MLAICISNKESLEIWENMDPWVWSSVPHEMEEQCSGPPHSLKIIWKEENNYNKKGEEKKKRKQQERTCIQNILICLLIIKRLFSKSQRNGKIHHVNGLEELTLWEWLVSYTDLMPSPSRFQRISFF